MSSDAPLRTSKAICCIPQCARGQERLHVCARQRVGAPLPAAAPPALRQSDVVALRGNAVEGGTPFCAKLDLRACAICS